MNSRGKGNQQVPCNSQQSSELCVPVKENASEHCMESAIGDRECTEHRHQHSSFAHGLAGVIRSKAVDGSSLLQGSQQPCHHLGVGGCCCAAQGVCRETPRGTLREQSCFSKKTMIMEFSSNEYSFKERHTTELPFLSVHCCQPLWRHLNIGQPQRMFRKKMLKLTLWIGLV